jgi:hypothetical protein
MPTETDYQAVLLNLETELLHLITESLSQLERISEVQWRIKEVTDNLASSAPRPALSNLGSVTTLH